jgi:inosine-uridine nucleoside N-ribohydrolase
MGEERNETPDQLRRHWRAMTDLGQSGPDSVPWPDDLGKTPMIIDTDIGGDADDALAVAAAARRIPELALVLTGDEVDGERARFARHLLDLMDRRDVVTVAGASLGGSCYYCVDGLIPDSVPRQADGVVEAVRQVCAGTDGPVRWVGMAPLTNLARVLAEAPELAAQLRVTQMGGALRYRNPESAEHNVRLDVPAAHAVLDAVGSGALGMPEFVASEVTFTPAMEVTAASPLYQWLREPDALPWARLLADHLDRWFEGFYPGSIQHDALTLTAAMDLPFVDSDRIRIEMDDRGRTTQAREEAGAILRWSMAATYQPFMDWLAESLTSSTTPSGVGGRD